MIGTAAILLAAAAATPAQQQPRSLSDSVRVALDVCTVSAFGGSLDLSKDTAFYQYAPGAFGEFYKKKGIPTTANSPELIQRFANTAANSRMFGARDFFEIKAADGQVWVVTTANKNSCDIAITGSAAPAQLQSAISDAFAADSRWISAKKAEQKNDVIWSAEYRLTSADGKSASLLATGLVGELAKADGIQVEIGFLAAPVANAAKE